MEGFLNIKGVGYRCINSKEVTDKQLLSVNAIMTGTKFLFTGWSKVRDFGQRAANKHTVFP